ncbi:MAG: peptide deformylase [Kiritimatiellia bacterium]|nr:peptide deformylase [Kiritimatiellia bacterium]
MIKIHIYGNPVLRVKASPVKSINKDVGKLANAMLELMIEKHGVGLAAQQVGETIRIFAMYVPPQYDFAVPDGQRLNPEINEPLVMINPVLLSRTGARSEKEGCLSIPEIFVPVRRAYEVLVSFLDLRGRQRQVKVKGLMARVIQHELDHLDGILFVDRISAIKRISLAGRLRKIKRAAKAEMQNAE